MVKVAVFCDVYLPGYKAGGPIPSISRIIETDQQNEFRIITRDRDAGDDCAYPDALVRQWQPLGLGSVAYLRPGLRDAAWISRELRRWKPDYYYFNSLHSIMFALLPLSASRSGLLPTAEVVLAPRGETSPGALGLKERKKRFARPEIKRLIGKDVTWHVSSALEESEVRGWWGPQMPPSHRFIVRSDLAIAPNSAPSSGRSGSGSIPTLTFASRIDRKKGLDRAIRIAGQVDPPLVLRVHGVVKEDDYWSECQDLATQSLSPSEFEYCGAYRPSDIEQIFASSVAFVFPTRGENFGHVVAEALSVGCPVMITPETPWTETVERGGGHVIRHDSDAVSYINMLLTEPESARVARREGVLKAYRDWYAQKQDLRSLFDPQ